MKTRRMGHYLSYTPALRVIICSSELEYNP